jgi:integrase
MIYPKPYKRNGIYYFKYTDRYGMRRQKSCKTHRTGQAQKVVRDFMESLSSSPVGNMKLSELIKPWTTGESNPRYERYTTEGRAYGMSRVRDIKYVLKHIENYRPMKMLAKEFTRGDALDLREWLITVELKDKSRTVNTVISALKTVYSEAIYRGELIYNPFAGIGEVKYEQKKKKLLTIEQVLELLKPKHWTSKTARQFCSLLIYTGMRFSELAALDWKKIDGDIMLINSAFKSDSANDLGLPKWNKVREIKISKTALSSLPPKGIGLVFLVNGHRVYHKWFRDKLADAIKKAKVDVITPHSFRHLINSKLLLGNVSPYLIQKYLGWSSGSSMITKVQEGYTHITSGDLQIVADAIDKIYTPKKKKAAGK